MKEFLPHCLPWRNLDPGFISRSFVKGFIKLDPSLSSVIFDLISNRYPSAFSLRDYDYEEREYASFVSEDGFFYIFNSWPEGNPDSKEDIIIYQIWYDDDINRPEVLSCNPKLEMDEFLEWIRYKLGCNLEDKDVECKVFID